MLDQNIDVVGLHLESPTACRSDVREMAKDLGIRLVVRPKGEEYLRLLRHPRFGYGRPMNPCLDCRVFMFQLGRPYLEEFGAQFLFTGEVVGQRPMSQMKSSLLRIDRHAELEGLVLRPLSAQLLPETEPERRGWVDRSRLLAIHGRGRGEQLALAERYGLKYYQSPGGGCLLTDAKFSAKLHDLFVHQPESRTTMDDVALLRIGRHVRVTGDAKVVLGRDREENGRLGAFANGDRWLVTPDGFPGPTALVCGPVTTELAAAATALIARHTHAPDPSWTVRWDDRGTCRRIALESVLDPPSAPQPGLDGAVTGTAAGPAEALEARN
jgi:hypothetical protein